MPAGRVRNNDSGRLKMKWQTSIVQLGYEYTLLSAEILI
jgi:hypothetical protein